jgi:hypothetical protein
MEDPTEEPDLRPPGGVRPATGEPRVDAALARLGELEGLPVTEHRAVFEDVHRRLRDVLGELDAGQASAPGQAATAPFATAPSAAAGQAGAARGAAHPARPGLPGR